MYNLDAFISDVGQVVKSEQNTWALTDKVKVLLSKFILEGEIDEKYCEPPENPKGVALHPVLVAEDGSYMIETVVLPAVLDAPLHDHGGVWSMIGCLKGKLYQPAYRRVDDGSKPGYCELALHEEALLEKGDVAVLPPHRDIHTVINLSGDWAVMLNVYGGDLSKVKRHWYFLKEKRMEEFQSLSPMKD
jgi:predicted metal-dependent enzyme (double-stranded beta helix superfamily)